ncbi:MAG TPA: ABC transporter ATP-binding protein, partial [Enterococcus sp.]|nr:ABC transporter ATP-binding protein [Enterococcus sp.]
MLEIQNLSVKLGKKDIIQQLSLSMETNQFIGIIGANGSGKSTLLKTIYKGLIPTTGKIVYNEMNLL